MYQLRFMEKLTRNRMGRRGGCLAITLQNSGPSIAGGTCGIDHITGYFSFRPHIVACQAKKVSSCHVSTGRVHTPCSLFEDNWDDDIVAEDEMNSSS